MHQKETDLVSYGGLQLTEVFFLGWVSISTVQGLFRAYKYFCLVHKLNRRATKSRHINLNGDLALCLQGCYYERRSITELYVRHL